MKRAGCVLGIVAMLCLSKGAAADAAGTQVPMCHGGFSEIPIQRDVPPSHRKNCPFGCHAPTAQQRKRGPGKLRPCR